MSQHHLNIAQELLMEMLLSVVGAIDKKAIHPGLIFARVDIAKDILTMTALDLEIQLVVSKKLGQEQENDFSFCLPVKKIIDFIKALPSEENLELVFDESCQKITLKAKHCLLEAASFPTKDFPSFATTACQPLFSISPENMKTALEEVSFSMAHNDIRYYLNGMLWRIEADGAMFVATDGHRMALTSRKIATSVLKQDDSVNMILPRRTILELNKLISLEQDKIEISFGRSYAVLHLGSVTFTTKLIEGTFPDYARVLPKDSQHHLRLHKEKLKLALMQVQPIISSKNKGVELKFSLDKLRIFAQNSQGEQVTALVDIDEGLLDEKQQLSLGLNLAYIYEYLQTVKEDTIQFCVNNSKSGVLLSHNDLTKYLVMPLTL